MDFSKIKQTAALSVVLGILNLSICLTHIYLYNSDFFMETEILKLVILGLGVLAVFFSISFLIVFASEGSENFDNTKNELETIGLSGITFEAGLLMLIPASISLVIKYFSPTLTPGYILIGYIVIMVLIAFLARSVKPKKEMESMEEVKI